MKPAVDEVFPEVAGPYVDLHEAVGSTRFLMDLATNEKAVHAEFLTGFEDLFKMMTSSEMPFGCRQGQTLDTEPWREPAQDSFR
ncbi:hypothetical protein H8958_004506 [Nasalis larvatus]